MSQLVSPLSIAIVAAVALVCGGLLIWSNTRRGRQAAPPEEYPALVHLNRWTLRAPYAALLIALVALLPLLIWPTILQWIYWGLLPSILGSAVLVGLIVAETVCFKAARTPGIASLERRGLTSYTPGSLIAVVGAVILGAGLFMAWVAHLTNGGQTAINMTSSSSGTITILMGGSYALTGPLLAAILIVTALAAGAVAIIAKRPRNGADSVLSHWDDALRRRSLRVTLTTLLGVIAASLVIMSADVLSGFHQSITYSMATTSMTPSTDSAWSVSFNKPFGPPFGSGAWTLQDNYYNALLAVAVAALLLALIAGAMMDIRSAPSPAVNIVDSPSGEPDEAAQAEPEPADAIEETQP